MAKIIFFGNERLATGVTTTTPTLQALINNGHEVVAVVSNYEIATSRKSRSLEIADVAQQHGIPVLLPNKPSEISDQLASYQADIGILVAYGKIVPQSIIDIFKHGIVNIHPSNLPKHRGPTPVESVILQGEKQTAVSVMQLVSAMDAGPVYKQQVVQLYGHETKQQLSDKLLQIGSELIIDVLPGVLQGTLKPVEQNNNIATYDSLIKKSDGLIDWTKSAEQIEREVRAYAGWPKSYTQINGIELAVTKVMVVEQKGVVGRYIVNGKELLMHCGQNSIAIERLVPAGKSEMDSQAFINGYLR